MSFNIPIKSTAPLQAPIDWVRPSDWIIISDTENEVQFLVADTGSKCFSIQTTFIPNSGTNIYIDWGDGNTITTISTSTLTTSEYVYSTGGTSCSRGYNTFKIRIYGDPTCQITNAKHISNFSVTGGGIYYNVGLLEAHFGGNTCNTDDLLTYYFNSSTVGKSLASFEYLEYVKLADTVSWTSQLSYMFQNCYNLYKVIMPTSGSTINNMDYAFQKCENLRDVTITQDAIGITTMQYTFQYCRNLRTVYLPITLNSLTNFTYSFSYCHQLNNITIPSINSLINFNTAFFSCYSLVWIKLTSMPIPSIPGTLVDFGGFLTDCWRLQNVYLPATCSINAKYSLANAFSNCYNLRNLSFPINFNLETATSMCSMCYQLTSVIFNSPMTCTPAFNSAFASCTLLSNIVLPETTSVLAQININGMFNSCFSLSSIVFPSAWQISDCTRAFQNCIMLKSVTLPESSTNITQMTSTFNGCFVLETVILPNLLTVASMNGTFIDCHNLTTFAIGTLPILTFPASMNSVTNFGQTFQNCYKITSITMPTSSTGNSAFVSIASNCYNLRSFTFPAVVASSAGSYNGLFTNCHSLTSVTFPTNQLSALTSLANTFQNCGSLTNITNLDKVGSLTATPLVNGSTLLDGASVLTSMSFSCPFTTLNLGGSVASFNKLNSLRLLNASAGQYTSASGGYQINVAYCDLGIAALDQLFTDLPTITSKTINITGCPGAADCTRSIATAKGWIITG